MTKISASNHFLKKADIPSQKELAVHLRHSGSTIAQVKAVTGLSAPTIIALNKVYQSGGMKAVQTRKIGRPAKSKQDLSSQSANEWETIWEQLFEVQSEGPWTFELLAQWLSNAYSRGNAKHINNRTAMRLFKKWGWIPTDLPAVEDTFFTQASQKKLPVFSGGAHKLPLQNKNRPKHCLLFAHDRRGKLSWQFYKHPLVEKDYVDFCQGMLKANPKGYALQLQFAGLQYTPALSEWLAKNARLALLKSVPQSNNPKTIDLVKQKSVMPSFLKKPVISSSTTSSHPRETVMSSHTSVDSPVDSTLDSKTLTHLQRLEAESIHIMREVVAEADKPVMLYSIGKDSAVMLHLALKAFYPAPLPFPLLHVDTGWKFKDMYAFRERMKHEHGFELLTHINPDGLAQGINPFTHGSQIHTDVMKTQGLKQALDQYGFDVAFGGARRDEEKSRAKERIFSFRNSQHRWDPKQQRPELWNLYNTKKHKDESIRVFPISNWTELDIWQYIYLEKIPIVPLYYAKERPVVERDDMLIMVDDERMSLAPGEVPMIKKVRFRTLGCYPLTGAVESQASTLPEIIQEMLLTKTSERQGRVIDHDSAASMEKKKQEGYF
jgi:sulfate adenylyltransferase subunit 2